jgi:hypothetical protein
LSSFIAKKLDDQPALVDTVFMVNAPASSARIRDVTRVVQMRIERGGERIWRLADFRDLPFAAVAQALSRLARKGTIERLSKGVYYRARETTFGKSRPNPALIQKLASARKGVFPSGIAAANMLGFTTQNRKEGEVSTSAGSLPRKLIGRHTIVHTRRPETWKRLSQADAALLDFLRLGGRASEMTPEETIARTIDLLSEEGRFERLMMVADAEPPRVRALLGALGEAMRRPEDLLRRLRATLNPYSRFDFGVFSGLPAASKWQAKGRT